jgi:hypothetical protein
MLRRVVHRIMAIALGIDHTRPRPDHRHLSAKHVEQLRQLVHACILQQGTHSRYSSESTLGSCCCELVNREFAAGKNGPLAHQDRLTATFQLDANANEGKKRRKHNERCPGDKQIKDALRYYVISRQRSALAVTVACREHMYSH